MSTNEPSADGLETLYRQIFADPEFQAVQRRRARFTWTLAAIMLAVYFGFILVIAFEPGFFAVPLHAGTVVSRGIPIGVGIIVLGFVLTGLYVRRANGEFDGAVARVVQRLEAQP